MKNCFKSTLCLLAASLTFLSGCTNNSEENNQISKPVKKDYNIFVYNNDPSIGKAFREMCDEYTARTGIIIRTVTPTEEENTVENLDSYINSQYPPDIFTVSSIDELKNWQQTENIWDFSNATEENFKEVVNNIPEGLRLSSNTKNSFGIPATVEAYGYIVDPKMISSLFGGDKYLKVLNALQECSYEEFENFVETLNRYINNESVGEITLNGKNFSFVSAKGELSENLSGVFSVAAPDAKIIGSYLLNPVLSCLFSSPAEAFMAENSLIDNLNAPLNKYCELLDLISTYTSGNYGILSRGTDFISTTKNGFTPSIKNFINGKSLFLVGSTKDYENISIFDLSVAKRSVFIPIKTPVTQYDISDLNKELNKNANKSITVNIPRYYCINAKSSENEKKAAQDFLVWLKTSDLAQKYVISEFGYVPYDLKNGNILDNPLKRSMIDYISENKFLPPIINGAPATWYNDVIGKKVINTLFTKFSLDNSDYDSVASYGVEKWKELKND